MGGRILERIDVEKESRPYIDCLYSVLRASGKFNGPKYLLAGMTGFSFIFVTHKDLILASTEVYNMKATSCKALDILGYYSEAYDGLKTNATFPLYQKVAIKRIKESIDEGVATIVWSPGITDFGVIYGYDDEDEVFFYKDRFNKEQQILLYSNLGKAEANYWMCHIIGDRIEKDIRDIYIQSLEFAVDCWETVYVDEIFLGKEFASGRMAYEYLIEALKKKDFHDLGAGKIIYYNTFSKKEAFLYLKDVKEEIPEAEPAYLKYKKLHEIYQRLIKLIPPAPIRGVDFKIDRAKNMDEIIELCTEAREVEEEAVGELKKLLKETLNNRYIDIYDVKKFK